MEKNRPPTSLVLLLAGILAVWGTACRRAASPEGRAEPGQAAAPAAGRGRDNAPAAAPPARGRRLGVARAHPSPGPNFTDLLWRLPGESLRQALARHGYFEGNDAARVLGRVRAMNRPWPRTGVGSAAAEPPPGRHAARLEVYAPYRRCLAPPPDAPYLCNTSMTRSLEAFDYFVSPYSLQLLLCLGRRERQATSAPRVLEVGMGLARVLLQLKRAWPGAEVHGINKSPTPGLAGPQDLLRVAEFFGIFAAPTELQRVGLPVLHFKNLDQGMGDLFAPGTFDLVFSQATLQYIARKDLLLQDIWASLRPRGFALLQVGALMVHSPEQFNVPTEKLWRCMRSRGFHVFEVHNVARASTFLLMYKNRPEPLSLPLHFLGQASGRPLVGRKEHYHSHYLLADGGC